MEIQRTYQVKLEENKAGGLIQSDSENNYNAIIIQSGFDARINN